MAEMPDNKQQTAGLLRRLAEHKSIRIITDRKPRPSLVNQKGDYAQRGIAPRYLGDLLCVLPTSRDSSTEQKNDLRPLSRL